MTHNQIAHAANLETQRHNVAFEVEQNRHNLATEAMESRKLDLQEASNRLQERNIVVNDNHYARMDANTAFANDTQRLNFAESVRHNRQNEAIQEVANAISHEQIIENARHNVANEQIAYGNLNELQRHNYATEDVAMYNANIQNYNSITQRLSQMSQDKLNKSSVALNEARTESEPYHRAASISETFKDSAMGIKFLLDNASAGKNLIALFK